MKVEIEVNLKIPRRPRLDPRPPAELLVQSEDIQRSGDLEGREKIIQE